jgi:hypothetical protein
LISSNCTQCIKFFNEFYYILLNHFNLLKYDYIVVSPPNEFCELHIFMWKGVQEFLTLMHSNISQLYIIITPKSISFHSIFRLGPFSFNLHLLTPLHSIKLNTHVHLIPHKFIHSHSIGLTPHSIQVHPLLVNIRVTFTFKSLLRE